MNNPLKTVIRVIILVFDVALFCYACARLLGGNGTFLHYSILVGTIGDVIIWVITKFKGHKIGDGWREP